jgi:hypothetical protein
LTAIKPARSFLTSRRATIATEEDPAALIIFVIDAFADVVAVAEAVNAKSFVSAALALVVAVELALTAMFFDRAADADVVAAALTAIAIFFVRLAEALTICTADAASAAKGLFSDAIALMVTTSLIDPARLTVLLTFAEVVAADATEPAILSAKAKLAVAVETVAILAASASAKEAVALTVPAPAIDPVRLTNRIKLPDAVAADAQVPAKLSVTPRAAVTTDVVVMLAASASAKDAEALTVATSLIEPARFADLLNAPETDADEEADPARVSDWSIPATATPDVTALTESTAAFDTVAEVDAATLTLAASD